jgi:glycerol-3-phosphate acyltransferase PlsY
MNPYLITAALSYLLGSIPFGYVLVRIFCGEDVRSSGSGNIGATNVARRSPALGVATLLLDAGKGIRSGADEMLFATPNQKLLLTTAAFSPCSDTCFRSG